MALLSLLPPLPPLIREPRGVPCSGVSRRTFRTLSEPWKEEHLPAKFPAIAAGEGGTLMLA